VENAATPGGVDNLNPRGWFRYVLRAMIAEDLQPQNMIAYVFRIDRKLGASEIRNAWRFLKRSGFLLVFINLVKV
jgi:hypothetical protein